MNNFKDLGISPKTKAFNGEKIKIDRVVNKQISVHHFEIKTSKYTDKGNGRCLYLQIETDGNPRLLMTGSGQLMDMIEQVPQEKFPFATTIVKQEDGGYLFT